MHRLPLVVFCLITAFFKPDPALAESKEYDWLTIGEKSGALIVESGADEISYSFSFNDRGRGPEIEARYQLGENGVPTAIDITGKNYMKGDAGQTFTLQDGVARWQAGAQEGEKRVDGPVLYMVEGIPAPEHTAIIARALLADPDNAMPAAPAGDLRIEEVETATFTSGDTSVEATLYALYAASPYPSYIWLDGERRLFGADYGWFALTPAGMSGALPEMKARQDAARDARTAELSTKFTHDASGLVVITGARLFDSLTGETKRRSTVFIQDGVISAVYDRAVDAPEGATVIDGAGKMLLPALWDMHAHIQTEQAFNYISAGVLNIRDMANDPDYLIRLRRDTAAGKIAAPDVYPMGFIDKRSPFAAPTGLLANTLEEALDFVEWYAQRGFLGIKLYSSIEPSWIEPIAAAAQERGLMVLGHIPSGMTAEEAIRAGYDEVTHINMLFLNFAENAKDIDTRTPQRFIVPIRDGGTLDVESPEVAALIELMKEKDIAHDPTFTIFQRMFLDTPGEVTIEATRFFDHLPAAERPGRIAGEGFNKGIEEEGRNSAEVSKALIVKLHENGIRVLPGTDAAYAGFVLLRELELLADAGIPPAEVLQLATIEAARHLRVDQSLGSVSPGKKAHLILVDGNPTRDLADLLKVDTVIKDTAVFRPAEIHETFGIRPFAE